jgi:type VI secretion system protein ImpE
MTMAGNQEVRATDLAGTLAAAQDTARREPGNAQHRVALFQHLAVTGEWPRALKQLEVAADLDPKLALFATAHKALVACETLRAEVFAGRTAPVCLGEPPEWLAHLVEALRLDGDGRHEAAKGLREQVFALAEARPGRLDGAPFAWLADADERLGPVVELILNGRYFWAPVERLRRLQIAAPSHLGDTVWLPVEATLVGTDAVSGFMPTRYPGSEAADDDGLRLAHRTEWRQLSGGSWVGLGQRMLATDGGEHALMDLRLVEVDGDG